MGSPNGFRDIDRVEPGRLPVEERRRTYDEFLIPLPAGVLSEQAARCMNCGVPSCHATCPVANVIPDWNDLVYRGDRRAAADALHATNNFPEFTGRVCPAPCEEACTLNLEDAPVTIKSIEYAIVETAWENRWIEPSIPRRRTDRSVAVVGSGPSGLAAAQQLARAGHRVVVFEKNARIGGLLRYGIPDFKLDKAVIDRRMSQMQAEGVEFRVNRHIGVNMAAENLLAEFDAIVLATGSERPRDLTVDGRDLDGVHFAIEFLSAQNRIVGGEPAGNREPISAAGKDVVVIGGGDTGSDCVGTAIRQGARSVTQFEILPKPPEHPDKLLTWPKWPNRLRTSTSHEEGCVRRWSVSTVAFEGSSGRVERLRGIDVEWSQVDGRWESTDVPGSEFERPADLVLLAMGFTGPVRDGLLEQLGVGFDDRGNIAADHRHATGLPGVFAAGDARRGQSLVVWAIAEGRRCAAAVDEYLRNGDHSD